MILRNIFLFVLYVYINIYIFFTSDIATKFDLKRNNLAREVNDHLIGDQFKVVFKLISRFNRFISVEFRTVQNAKMKMKISTALGKRF